LWRAAWSFSGNPKDVEESSFGRFQENSPGAVHHQKGTDPLGVVFENKRLSGRFSQADLVAVLRELSVYVIEE
jgi:hypothetical protein